MRLVSAFLLRIVGISFYDCVDPPETASTSTSKAPVKTTTSTAAGEISTIPKQEADETVSPEKDVDTPETKPEEDEVEVDEAKPEEINNEKWNSNVKESAEASDDGDDFVALKQLRNRNNRVAIVILSLGLITTAIALMVVGCRLRTMRRRLRKGRAINSNEADYLINGMYL